MKKLISSFSFISFIPWTRLTNGSLCIGLFFCLGTSVFGQSDYEVPRTEYGQADLQGVWNFASHTPVQRREDLGDKAFFTPEEDQQNRERSITHFGMSERQLVTT